MSERTITKPISYEEKLEIMKRYQSETGKRITSQTRWNGYFLGSWKSNIRQRDGNGTLNITEELRRQFEEIGIITPKERRDKKSDLEKYEYILNLYNQNQSFEHLSQEDYQTLLRYKRSLQDNYSSSKLNLNIEQINFLVSIGILYRFNANDIEPLLSRYGISKKQARTISRKAGSIEKFIDDYKKGKIDKINVQGLYMASRGIAITRAPITSHIRDRYILLVNDIVGYDFREEYLDIDEINSLIETLTSDEREILNSYYGLDGSDRKTYMSIAQEYGVTSEAIRQRIVRIKEKLKSLPIKRNKNDDLREKRRVSNKISRVRVKHMKSRNEVTIEDMKPYLSLTAYNCLQRENLRRRSTLKPTLESIISIEQAVADNGPRIKHLGQKTREEIREVIRMLRGTIEAPELDIELSRLRVITERINIYNEAVRHFNDSENIFNPNEIIPARITTENETEFNSNIETDLERKREEKRRRRDISQKLDKAIENQNQKAEMLEQKLEENGVTPSSKGEVGNGHKQ